MSKKTDKIDVQIDNLIEKADQLALAEVERLARKIMRRNPKSITCFCMAMGYATFYDKNGSLDDNDHRTRELDDFIGTWDRILHLTGTPMKIEGKWDSPVITDW